MTSSLVGSEMCIRDSLYGARMARFDLLRAVSYLAACVTKWTLTCDPVSYTHLTLPTICSV
eukprot:2603983-Prorocentrum_lima.AAC.1